MRKIEKFTTGQPVINNSTYAGEAAAEGAEAPAEA